MHALEVVGCRLRDLHPGPHRTSDRDHLRCLVIDHEAAGRAVTGDHIEHAVGQKLGGDLRKQQRRRRRCVAGLENGGVSGGDGRGNLPHRHVQRIVPRGDLTDHTNRFAPDRRGVVFHILGSRHTAEVACFACKETNLIDGEHDLVCDEGCSRLTGVFRFQVGELLRSSLHRIRYAEQR